MGMWLEGERRRKDCWGAAAASEDGAEFRAKERSSWPPLQT